MLSGTLKREKVKKGIWHYFGLSKCFWQLGGAVYLFGTLHLLSLTSLLNDWNRRLSFTAVEKAKGKFCIWSTKHIFPKNHIALELGEVSEVIWSPSWHWGTKRFRRGHGTHLITRRVQNENPGVLMIRLKAPSTTGRRIHCGGCWTTVCHWPGEVPTHQYSQHPSKFLRFLSEVLLQYLLSIHSLPQFYSTLWLLDFRYIQAYLIFYGVQAITWSQGTVY